jgi:hypothetical protein
LAKTVSRVSRGPLKTGRLTSACAVTRFSTFSMKLLGGHVDPAKRGRLQSRVNRFAFEREDAEDALVDTAQRFVADEAFQRLDAERKLPQRE